MISNQTVGVLSLNFNREGKKPVAAIMVEAYMCSEGIIINP